MDDNICCLQFIERALTTQENCSASGLRRITDLYLLNEYFFPCSWALRLCILCLTGALELIRCHVYVLCRTRGEIQATREIKYRNRLSSNLQTRFSFPRDGGVAIAERCPLGTTSSRSIFPILRLSFVIRILSGVRENRKSACRIVYTTGGYSETTTAGYSMRDQSRS